MILATPTAALSAACDRIARTHHGAQHGTAPALSHSHTITDQRNQGGKQSEAHDKQGYLVASR
eukprot:5255325-Prymnesium_polylepis.2